MPFLSQIRTRRAIRSTGAITVVDGATVVYIVRHLRNTGIKTTFCLRVPVVRLNLVTHSGCAVAPRTQTYENAMGSNVRTTQHTRMQVNVNRITCDSP